MSLENNNNDDYEFSENSENDSNESSSLEDLEDPSIEENSSVDESEESNEQESEEITNDDKTKDISMNCIYLESEKNQHVINTKKNYVDIKHRITKPRLFSYERVRVIGARAKMLSLGAKPMIKNTDNLDSKSIAEMELRNKVLPYIIERPLPGPGNRYELWKLSELQN